MATCDVMDTTDINCGEFMKHMKLDIVRVLYKSQQRKVTVVEVSDIKKECSNKAIKIIPRVDKSGKTLKHVADYLNEIKILQLCDHPYVMSLESAVVVANAIYICMPLYSRGALDTMRSKLEMDHISRYFPQTACALRYLHRKRIIHGDIKPANILIDASDNAILSDFDCAKLIAEGEDSVSIWRGTKGYIAPEYVLGGHPVNPFLVIFVLFKLSHHCFFINVTFISFCTLSRLKSLQNSRCLGLLMP